MLKKEHSRKCVAHIRGRHHGLDCGVLSLCVQETRISEFSMASRYLHSELLFENMLYRKN